MKNKKLKDKNSWELKIITIVGVIGSGMSSVVNYKKYLEKKNKITITK